MSTRTRIEAVERLAALLDELYLPAGQLFFISAPHRLLDGRTTADAIHAGDVAAIEKVCNALDALADGAFL